MPSVKAQGFTLVEVLLATVILFLFMAMAAQTFSQAASSSVKAERAAIAAATVPFLLNGIKSQIDQAKTTKAVSGQGELKSVAYQWRATLVSRKAPIDGFDPLSLEFKSYADKFNLWRVDLTITMGSYQRQWIYEELTWFEQ